MRVECRVCGQTFTLPLGTIQLPPHNHRDMPGVECVGTMWYEVSAGQTGGGKRRARPFG
jgi:hypothetical protein